MRRQQEYNLEEVINPVHWIRIATKLFIIVLTVSAFAYFVGFSGFVFDRTM